MGDAVGVEIINWIELLVNNVDMHADSAVYYLKELRSHTQLDKMYKKVITGSVSDLVINNCSL